MELNCKVGGDTCFISSMDNVGFDLFQEERLKSAYVIGNVFVSVLHLPEARRSSIDVLLLLQLLLMRIEDEVRNSYKRKAHK